MVYGEFKQVIKLKNKLTKEDIQFREQIHLRNLKRKYSKIIQHADLTDEALKVKKEIDLLESQWNQPLFFNDIEPIKPKKEIIQVLAENVKTIGCKKPKIFIKINFSYNLRIKWE